MAAFKRPFQVEAGIPLCSRAASIADTADHHDRSNIVFLIMLDPDAASARSVAASEPRTGATSDAIDCG